MNDKKEEKAKIIKITILLKPLHSFKDFSLLFLTIHMCVGVYV